MSIPDNDIATFIKKKKTFSVWLCREERTDRFSKAHDEIEHPESIENLKKETNFPLHMYEEYVVLYDKIKNKKKEIFTNEYLISVIMKTLDKINFPELNKAVLKFSNLEKVIELAKEIEDEELQHVIVSQFITIWKGKHVWNYKNAGGKYRLENVKIIPKIFRNLSMYSCKYSKNNN
jgi:hypothetical protein